MAEDKKKTKIDLKARLGRTTQVGSTPTPGVLPPTAAGPTPPPPSSEPGSGAAPGSAPVPQAPASRPASASVRPPMPMGIAPPAGLSQGIPLPPFGPQRPARAPEPKPSAAQQTIKVEIGEEVHEERKKWRNRIALGALAGALIGGFLGFTAGGSNEKGDRAKSAARGAGLLTNDVVAANDKLKDLDKALTDAAEKLKAKSFPDDLGTALSAATIPFDDTNLDGKGVNGMNSRLFKMVSDYTATCKSVNKMRESLRNLSGITKDPITKAWKEETTPVAHFSVVFRTEGGKNVVGELVPNPSPFAWKGDQPEKYKITKLENNRPAEKEAKRYQKGDLPGNDLTAVPVDPKTTAAFTSEVMLGRLNKAIYDLRIELQGNKENPTNETPGVLKMGEDLATELRKACITGLDAAQCKDLIKK